MGTPFTPPVVTDRNARHNPSTANKRPGSTRLTAASGVTEVVVDPRHSAGTKQDFSQVITHPVRVVSLYCGVAAS